jgi:hypothetical protein
MIIKNPNRNALTPLSISSHTDVQLDSSEPLTTVLSLHWLKPRSIDAEIGTIIEKVLKRGCNCMERPETLVIKLNTMLKNPKNSII